MHFAEVVDPTTSRDCAAPERISMNKTTIRGLMSAPLLMKMNLSATSWETGEPIMSFWVRWVGCAALSFLIVSGCVRRQADDPESNTPPSTPVNAPLPKADVDTLIRAASDSDPDIRFWGIMTLVKRGEGAKPALEVLIHALGDSHVLIRPSAAEALANLGPDAAPALRPLLNLLKEGDGESRKWSAIAIGKMGPHATEAVDALALATRDREEEVRLAAIMALGRIGPSAKAAVPALIHATEDRDESIRKHATLALKQIDPDTANRVAMRVGS